jgi:hypothetical protein
VVKRGAALVLALAVSAAAGCAAAGASARAHPGGEAVFEWRGPADAVLLRGSMTGWQPVPVPRSGKVFRLVLPLSPGRYEYRLEVRHGETERIALPEGAERVSDGFGGENAVLRVP